MKPASLPTMRVKSPHFAEGVRINKAAFDALQHQPVEKKPSTPSAVKKTQTALKAQ